MEKLHLRKSPPSNPDLYEKGSKKIKNEISKHSLVNSALLFILCLAFIITISIALTTQGTDFKAKSGQSGVASPGSPGLGSLSLIPADDLKRTLPIVCTNKSAVGSIEIFSGLTIIAYNCPKSTNPCSEWICSYENGRCSEVLIDTNDECFSDVQCGIGGSCDITTCECFSLPNTTTGCITDANCPDISDRGTCVKNICVSGDCVETIQGAGVCWYDGQCTPDQFCNNSTCNCDTRPVIPCLVNSDCPNITDRGMCSTYECISEECVETIQGMGECWFSGQCNSTQRCDQTDCKCVNKVQCSVDDDCTDVSDRGNCSANLCISGTCTESILLNGTCWLNEQCQTNQICNQENCTCVPAPLNQCQQDSDCPDISDRGSCVTNVCTLGVCIETIQGLGICWFDGQCASDESCNQNMCFCEADPIITCSFDSDCTNITDRGMCVINDCVNGTCVETIQGLGKCWFDGQCAIGSICDQSTCGCVVSTDTCLTGYDVRAIPAGFSSPNVSCGIDIAISGNNLVLLCINYQDAATDIYALSSYVKSGTTWIFYGYFVTGVQNEGLPLTQGADIAIWDGFLAFVGKDVNGAQPTSPTLQIWSVDPGGPLTLIQSIPLSFTSALNVAIDIWNTTIVVTNELAFIYDQATITTWTQTQIFNTTAFSYIDCAIYEGTLALSVNRNDFNDSSVNVTWESYFLSSGTWTLINSFLIDDFVGNWRVALIQTNNPSSPLYDFLIILTPDEVPMSLYQIYSSGAILLQNTFFVTSTGIGSISSFNRNVLISDVMFLNSMVDAMSFHSKFEGNAVISNSLDDDQPAFLTFNSTLGEYVAYANFCDTS